MDPRRFYGGIHTIVKDFPDSSADEDLSDDEQLTNRRRNVLPPLRTLADSDPYLPLADFKCAVAEGLSQSNKPSTSGKRGRPSYELENAIEAKKLRGPIAIMPSRDVRLDQIDHMPLWTTRQRCKVPECNGRSHVECQNVNGNLMRTRDAAPATVARRVSLIPNVIRP
ncbi:hypothetical protein EVAR_102751_1 [Eumeta japonica]|uniref:Uncharacterized protein n=1 Tax=Eumeta variegata TaxID=151549 RepID=A0A4C1TL81_EUMVA|nr:hypothetical protein EVAR_102751_1 [Eumeta japonica]